MLATEKSTTLMVQLVAPLAWRNPDKIATKLEGFAATEAGSALDMLKAAELCSTPKYRRLFFRHAIDEARHARLFSEAARQMGTKARGRHYEVVRSKRQDMYAELGLTHFLAFVHLAEKSGEAQFRSLEKRFRDDPQLGPLFLEIADDEVFHVRYSGGLLDTFRKNGQEKEVKAALRKVRFQGAWRAWRRAGRRIGELLNRIILGATYVLLLAPFALIQKISSRRRKKGWQKRQLNAPTLETMGREW